MRPIVSITADTSVVILFALLLLSGALVASAQRAEDFVSCMQEGRCGLEYVCDYALGEADMRGTIARIRSNLDTPLLAKWRTSEHEGAVTHPVRIDAHSSHLIRTTTADTRMIRLTVEDQVVDVLSIRHSQVAMCPEHLACQYLLHACYNAIDDAACDAGTAFCNKVTGPANVHAREACIPSCLSSFYGDELEFWKGDPFQALQTPEFGKYTYSEDEFEERSKSRYGSGTSEEDRAKLYDDNEDARRDSGLPLMLSDGERRVVGSAAYALHMTPVDGHEVPEIDGHVCPTACPGLIVVISIMVLINFLLIGFAIYYYRLYRGLTRSYKSNGSGDDGDTTLL